MTPGDKVRVKPSTQHEFSNSVGIVERIIDHRWPVVVKIAGHQARFRVDELELIEAAP